MDTVTQPPVMPHRPGLPLDPVLQLYAGVFRVLSTVTFSGGVADPVAPANPNRVALYVWFTGPTGDYSIAPYPGPASTAGNITWSPAPLVIHCRDYPGIVQGSWVGAGVAASSVVVGEYALQPWWS